MLKHKSSAAFIILPGNKVDCICFIWNIALLRYGIISIVYQTKAEIYDVFVKRSILLYDVKVTPFYHLQTIITISMVILNDACALKCVYTCMCKRVYNNLCKLLDLYA